MRSPRSFLVAVFGGGFLVACGDGTGPGEERVQRSLECTEASSQILAVGEHRILDPDQSGACVRLPAAGSTVAEHLYIPVATQGRETNDGVRALYQIAGSSPSTVAATPLLGSPLRRASPPRMRAGAFHSMLRARERALSQSRTEAFLKWGRVTPTATVPPVVGEVRTFKVCSTPSCDNFVDATATARVVANRVAIFVDNGAPPGGYSDSDLADVGALFDGFLYPIDTTAFGRESDIDANGVVVVLLTQSVNALSPDCNATESVILGYFFGADLLPRSSNNPGSNEAEIFYGLVPDPSNPACDITETFARERLPATFIHEFQHMISFNQHRLLRGTSAEDTWLNEGLSHFAEELAGLQLPAAECPSGSCYRDFLARGNVSNAFAYLDSTEAYFLIEPGSSNGSLPERGANWLFVRWLVDHFAGDSVLGTNLTRQLVATSLVGAANVTAVAGAAFSTLVPEWQMANYLDDLPGFDQPATRLRYRTWNFREVAAFNGDPFPLVPDSTSGVAYNHRGVLRAGSGRHIRVVQAPGAGAVDLEVAGLTFQPKRLLAVPLPSSLSPRIALVRIR